MAIRYFHEGNPLTNTLGQKSPRVLASCDQELFVNNHNIPTYQSVRVKLGQDDFGDGCVCDDDTPLAIGDVLTLGQIPAGQAIKDVLWHVSKADPTLELTLEVRKNATAATVAGTSVATSLGNEVRDGFASPNQYFSHYGVASCAGKDCYGTATTSAGKDHGVLVAVVTALPTGVAGGCSTKAALFGTAQINIAYVVTDLR